MSGYKLHTCSTAGYGHHVRNIVFSSLHAAFKCEQLNKPQQELCGAGELAHLGVNFVQGLQDKLHKATLAPGYWRLLPERPLVCTCICRVSCWHAMTIDN